METIETVYANALLSLCIENKEVERSLKDMKFAYEEFDKNPELVTLISSAFLEKEEKISVVDKVFSPLFIPSSLNFLKLLVDKNVSTSVLKILKRYINLANSYLSIASGVVYSVSKLSDEDMRRLKEAFSKKLNRKVELVNYLDSSLIGGIKIIIDNKVYDKSILSQLDGLRTTLKKGGAI